MISRNTALTYRNKGVDTRQIGREHGVRYVLQGSVRRTGDQLRINAQLIDAETDGHLWAERFDSDCQHLAEAQNDVAGRVGRAATLRLVEAVASRNEQRKTLDPGASDLVRWGWAALRQPMLKGTYDEAASFFRRAPVIDSKSVDAQIGIAWVLIANIADGWSNSVPQDQARAEELLLEATQESAIGASAHATFGLLRRLPNRLAEAQIAWETAIALDPNNATAFRQVGFTLIFSGQPEAAIPEFEKGLRLGPNEAGTPSACAGLGLRYLLVGQVEKAVDLLRKARADNTRLHYTHMLLAAALALKGDFEEAETALAHGIKLKPEIDSLARMRASLPYTNPAYVSLVEKTVFLGLRKAVTPEE